MENKSNKIIHDYFGKRFSKKTRMLFAKWFVAEDDADEKKAAMKSLWDDSQADISPQTIEDLNALKAKMSDDKPVSRSTLALPVWTRYAAAVAVLFVSVGLTYYFTSRRMEAKTEIAEMKEFFVPYGENQHITLADGSEVWVNAGSFIVYPEKFDGDKRIVYLSGKARFSVAKNPEKPFIVKTNHIAVEALGTVFDVQAYPDENYTMATLEEGNVRVESVGGGNLYVQVLKPDEQLILDHLTGKFEVSEIDASVAGLWRDGYLIFENSDFGTLVSTIERKYNVHIYYDATKYANRIYNAKFRPQESLDDVLNILKQLIGLSYTVKEDKIYIN